VPLTGGLATIIFLHFSIEKGAGIIPFLLYFQVQNPRVNLITILKQICESNERFK